MDAGGISVRAFTALLTRVLISVLLGALRHAALYHAHHDSRHNLCWSLCRSFHQLSSAFTNKAVFMHLAFISSIICPLPPHPSLAPLRSPLVCVSPSTSRRTQYRNVMGAITFRGAQRRFAIALTSLESPPSPLPGPFDFHASCCSSASLPLRSLRPPFPFSCIGTAALQTIRSQLPNLLPSLDALGNTQLEVLRVALRMLRWCLLFSACK